MNQIDKKMLKYLDYNNGFFIELGANDGFTQSNTLALENKRGWRGILIEPTPHLFLSCCFFREKDGNHIYCCACVPFEYQDKYVEIDYANLMSVSTQLDSDIADMEQFKAAGKAELTVSSKDLKFGAPARTLNSILSASNAPNKIDFMSLDVEGAELDVLRGLNFDEFCIKFILVECRNFDRVNDFLQHKNYTFVEKMSHHDYLFRNNAY